MFRLRCAVQTYGWGKIGSTSAVANLSCSGNPGFACDAATPYAELWMGAHPKSPSLIITESGESLNLASWLANNSWALGQRVHLQFAGELPFLFKVLSVRTALSIQAHPNKEDAVKLHSSDPLNYPDPNHKPEVAIALSDFEGMCGFRPVVEIANFIDALPSLANVLNLPDVKESIDTMRNGTPEEMRTMLKQCFAALMTAPVPLVQENLTRQSSQICAQTHKSALDSLFLRLCDQYPGDVGCFCIYFLNVVTLKPGQAMFLGPNEPHAYLSGDCVECMACSDNVVRAGLTPKFKDVPYLCKMLTYSSYAAQSQVFEGLLVPGVYGLFQYPSPVPDFAVARVEVTASSTLTLPRTDSPRIFIVTKGQGYVHVIPSTNPDASSPLSSVSLSLTYGSVVFLAADYGIHCTSTVEGLQLFCASC